MMNYIERPRGRLISSLVPAFLLGACLTTGSGSEGVALPLEGVDRFELIEGQERSTAGCQFDYRVFVPTRTTSDSLAITDSTGDDPLVVIGHGFLRHQDTMSTLARRIANTGHRVTTLEFCNMRPWNGHHVRNGDDMRLLAERLGSQDVIYAGFSAGALAAVLAGAGDPKTVAVITLDLVDQGGLAVAAANTLEVPVLGFAGDASSCNRMGDALRLFEDNARSKVVSVVNASHCEFESPTDGWCETACGDDDSDSVNESQRSAIVDSVVTRIHALLSGRGMIDDGRSIVVAPQYRQ